jgi:tetratricopeptide (TPR) repeat protein
VSVREKFTKALDYNRKSLALAGEIGDRQGTAVTYGSIGLILSNVPDSICLIMGMKPGEQFPMALKNFEKSLDLKKQIGDQQGIAITLSNIADVYLKQGDHRKAMDLARQALSMAIEMSDVETEISAHKTLFESLKATGKPRDALREFELYVHLHDSMEREDNKKEITRKELTYEYEKRESELTNQQEKERVLAVAESRRQQLIIGLFAIIAVAIGVIAFFAFLSLRSARAQKRIIEAKNKEILDSIHYAQKIQRSLLPSEKYIERELNDARRDNAG